MEFDIKYIHHDVDQPTLTKAIAKVLHADRFYRYPDYDVRPENLKKINFKATLNTAKNMGVRNDGTGSLVLPSVKIGNEFMKWLQEVDGIRLQGRKVKFYRCRPKRRQFDNTVALLHKTPYIDPDLDERRRQLIADLAGNFRIDVIQMGVFYRDRTVQSKGRSYSVEWEKSYETEAAWLRFEYEHKLIRIELGNRMVDEIGTSVVVPFKSISRIGLGHDFGRPFICFVLFTPPIFLAEDYNRPLTLDERHDSRKFRRRIISLDASHARVAPYAHQLRILLYNDPLVDELGMFAEKCCKAGLHKPFTAHLDARAQGFFSAKRLDQVERWLRTLDWTVAFQIEALLRNGLLNTRDLLEDLFKPINDLCCSHPTRVGDILRYFTQALHSRGLDEDVIKCFEKVRSQTLKGSALELETPNMFMSQHVTITPTRVLLEGPFPTQSNRIIREYPGKMEHFLRVDFRDEDRLQHRWDRDVDGTTFLQERVGTILKSGFELGGRYFEFLAYSSSALRAHQVWFINPFEFANANGMSVLVDAEHIRKNLGTFSGDLMRQPSKYAARIAQAFTATDSSDVEILQGQWEEIEDMLCPGTDYCFTDGIGSISQQLGDKIWSKLCKDRRDGGQRAVKPSAYQIRFMGFKGVVSVDPELNGPIQMRLRRSMKKFEGKTKGAKIEIARAFDGPSSSHLNRALIKVLEDRGVAVEAFKSLQDQATLETQTMLDNLDQFTKVVKSNKIGSNFHLHTILERLLRLGFDLKSRGPSRKTIDDPFLKRLGRFAMVHILRDIKHQARIKIPDSYLLVGVVDEGPAYVAAGRANIYTLPENNVFVCVQGPDDSEPKYITGVCTVSRSPVVHPGDVQTVFAIGPPPIDQGLCLFRNMKNVVVFPAQGRRPMPSCLAGGDLDGDIYDVVAFEKLLPNVSEQPASYVSQGTLDIGRRCNVNDICDFVVEYINSDILGLLSDKHLTIADQSSLGTRDPDCLKLAAMCSQAVDYAKNGIPVHFDSIPRRLMLYKPDWHAAEVDSPRPTDYYESYKALGVLYREITLEDRDTIVKETTKDPHHPLMKDPLFKALKPRVKRHLSPYSEPNGESPDISLLFQRYHDEMVYISTTHVITVESDSRLREEEIVVGTILAKCSQRRWRKDRVYRMGVHTSNLVHEVERELVPDQGCPTRDDLKLVWDAFAFSRKHQEMFGASSFGLIALALLFECLDKLDLEG